MQVQGSSLAIVHINQRTLKMSIACYGGANAVLGELVHGLAAQVSEAPHRSVRSGLKFIKE